MLDHVLWVFLYSYQHQNRLNKKNIVVKNLNLEKFAQILVDLVFVGRTSEPDKIMRVEVQRPDYMGIKWQ